MKVLELFGGIGACTNALRNLNIDFEIVDYVEIDKYAVKSYNAIYGTNFEPQDITKWDKNIEVDLIMHGSPCQDFSLAGKQAGGDKDSGTRSSLMYETLRIVEKLKPKYVIWENVKNILSKKHKHNFDTYLAKMECLGYVNYYQVLNAKDYGIPQNRERVFTISILNGVRFEFPAKQKLKLSLKDMLEDEVDKKYYLNEKLIQNLKFNKNNNCNPSGKGMNGKVHNGDVAPTLTTNKGEGPKVDVTRLYGIFDKENKSHQGGSVYDQDGLSPTLTDMQGGYRQPCIEVKRVIEKLPGMGNGGGNVPILHANLRIRKLTPNECWRLMGFQDEDFEKAERVNSNTQLYKQAGNSIVVNVLEAILEKLLRDEEND